MEPVDAAAHRQSGECPLGFIGKIDTRALMQKSPFFGKFGIRLKSPARRDAGVPAGNLRSQRTRHLPAPFPVTALHMLANPDQLPSQSAADNRVHMG